MGFVIGRWNRDATASFHGNWCRGVGVFGPPGSVRPEIERLEALGRLAQQRELERVTQNELDRVAREQRKVEEDDWTSRLQCLKDQVVAEEQKTRTLHMSCQDLQAECDRLRVQRD